MVSVAHYKSPLALIVGFAASRAFISGPETTLFLHHGLGGSLHSPRESWSSTELDVVLVRSYGIDRISFDGKELDGLCTRRQLGALNDWHKLSNLLHGLLVVLTKIFPDLWS
jgi:hypothetical protein